jgi:hypothetical protein
MNNRYIDEYSSVPNWGLLAIDGKPMIPPLRRIQFLSEDGQPEAGWVTPGGAAVGRVRAGAGGDAHVEWPAASRVLPPLACG